MQDPEDSYKIIEDAIVDDCNARAKRAMKRARFTILYGFCILFVASTGFFFPEHECPDNYEKFSKSKCIHMDTNEIVQVHVTSGYHWNPFAFFIGLIGLVFLLFGTTIYCVFGCKLYSYCSKK